MTLTKATLESSCGLLAQIIDSNPVPIFAIDDQHHVILWNRACAALTNRSAEQMLGTSLHQQIFYSEARPTMADLIVTGTQRNEMKLLYGDKRLVRSEAIPGAYEAEDFFPGFGEEGCWLYFTAAPLFDDAGRIVGAIETLQDVSSRRLAEQRLVEHQKALEHQVRQRSEDLIKTQQQLLQSEKLASIGQLAAGVAHEINNPIGFVHSNMSSLEDYFSRLLKVLKHFETHSELIAGTGEAGRAWVAEIDELKQHADYEYLKEDIPFLLAESAEGIERVRRIVADLKDFSRVDSGHQWERADLRACLESTLNIVRNEIRYAADVIKEYGDLPPVECIPSQINQVFMNLIVNAAQAISAERRGTITLRSGQAGDKAWIEVADNGSGMSEETRKKLFDPFFTTKPVGKGTGLGLSLSHGIIEKHGGRIEVESTPGVGTTFRVVLPLSQHHEAKP